MLRTAVLALLAVGLLASQASAKTVHASAWKGKLIVSTTFTSQDERHKPGYDNVRHGEGDHVMSGRIPHLLIPKGRSRSSWLSGSGSLDQLKGSVKSSMSDVDAIRSLHWDCNGKIRNNGGGSLQARFMPGYSGALKLVVDGFSLVAKETCTPGEGWSSPTQIDGWPEDFVFPLPSPSSRKAALQSDWWRFSSSCGLGEEREGSGAPPGPVDVTEDGERCISGTVVRIETLLDLRRTCADVKLTYSASSAREKCLRR